MSYEQVLLVILLIYSLAVTGIAFEERRQNRELRMLKTPPFNLQEIVVAAAKGWGIGTGMRFAGGIEKKGRVLRSRNSPLKTVIKKGKRRGDAILDAEEIE